MLKVLILSNGYRAIDDRTRINFLKMLQELCDLKIYGPGEYDKAPELAPYKFEINDAKEIIKLFQPDVILIPLWKDLKGVWVPEGISKHGIPVAVLEEDHYEYGYPREEITLNGYLHHEFHLIIRRHFYYQRQPLNTVWLPFSASEKEFYPDESIPRKNIIGFAGTGIEGNVCRGHKIRQKAYKILLENNLLDKKHGKIVGAEYSKYLRSHTGSLACAGSTIHAPMAKCFEIILSGTALLTNMMENSTELFGDKRCYFQYKDDCSDVVERAQEILNNPNKVDEVVYNAMNRVLSKHTDSKRVTELYNILNSLASGGQP